ncbi:MAG: Hsp20/alpha crystallin family protein [Firmicutes bacterium]|nr:Hsp20/alpha crystallin family protein [Bacillota bacterium]
MSLLPVLREFDDGLAREMTSWMERFFDEPWWTEWPRPVSALVPAVDVVDAGDRYEVRMDVPGVTKEDLEVSLEDGQLVIRGEKRAEAHGDGARYHWTERRQGRFVRRIRLPEHIRAEAVTAALKDGVLTVTVPKTEGASARKIAIAEG